MIADLKDENEQVRAQSTWDRGLKGDHLAVEALNAAMKDQSKDVRKKAAWALGLILMRDGKAADKAADLDLNLNKDVEAVDEKEADDDTIGGVRVPGNVSIPIPVPTPTPMPNVNVSIPIPVPIPIPIPNVNVTPRVVVAPDGNLPSKTKSKQKEK